MPELFRNILIANRGEIALRIIRTIRKSGLNAIGIYSEQDQHSPWIMKCNQAWSLGDGKLSDTYLNIQKIISIAKESCADAIHPGYGFLSENYAFAEACRQNGIAFIGPAPETLKITGDKQLSHDIAFSLGIPVPRKITGTLEELLSDGLDIHFPVLAKAAFGGGGKGIRLVKKREELGVILKTVSEEAFNYFGDSRVYLEQFIENPRHLEIQIIGDSHGNIIHLFERECSVQRRHQKLIEESPSVSLLDGTRISIINAALKIAKHLNYQSAGTIEFLVDENENFCFLEINPRIQVEHGVTELVTGMDIVKEQIYVAAGYELSVKQNDLELGGHAIEARIYAEDPENNMFPLPGQIQKISFPEGDDIRVDSAVTNGSFILSDFDPLIAKIMVHGFTRKDTIEKMQHALNELVITGLPHNAFLQSLIFADDDFIKNKLSANWLENKFTEFTERYYMRRKAADSVELCIAAALIVLSRRPGETDSPWKNGFWRNVHQIRFRFEGQTIELNYDRSGSGKVSFVCDDRNYTIAGITIDEFAIDFSLEDRISRWYVVPEKEGTIGLSDGHIQYNVERYLLRESGYETTDEVNASQANTVLAPQPGTIVEIKVTEGQKVNRGDYLLTIESMKLENTILAVTGGIIKKINIKTGDRVRKDEPLIYLHESIIK